MTDTDTDRWVKDTLISHTKVHERILNKLEAGEQRMGRIEESLTTVVEATQDCSIVKLDVQHLKKADDLRKREEQLHVKQELDAMKAQKAIWGQRFWELFVKALPFILVGAMFIYSQIKTQL